MVRLGVFQNPRLAQGFVDYLNSIGITSTLKPIDPHQSAVYVNESQLSEAQNELRSFERNPNQPKYFEASWQVGSTKNGLSYAEQPLNLFARFIKLSLIHI